MLPKAKLREEALGDGADSRTSPVAIYLIHLALVHRTDLESGSFPEVPRGAA